MTRAFESGVEKEGIWLNVETSREAKMTIDRDEKEIGTLTEKNANRRSKHFDEFLVEAIDEAITTLGAPVKNSLYQHLEVDFCLPKEEIPARIVEFDEIIHKIFGLGACRLEIKFMKNLYSKIQAEVSCPEIECEMSKWIIREASFIDYVQTVRRDYETKRGRTP